MRAPVVVLATLLLSAPGCRTDGGGGVPPSADKRDWFASVPMTEPLTFDATHIRHEITLEASIALTTTPRLSTREITGLVVIAELDMVRTDTEIGVELAREGEQPGYYGTDVTRGTYTYGHGQVTVLDPLSTCYVPPCAATERYTLVFDTIANPGVVTVTWRASLHVILSNADPDSGVPVPADDEALTLTIVPAS